MSCSFHRPAFEDIRWMKEKLKESQPLCCEFSVGNLMGWSKYYDGRIGEIENCLVVRLYNDNSFCFPKGSNYINALKFIVKEYDFPKFSFLEAKEKDILEETFPGKYEFVSERDAFDYVYSQEHLASLSGKKYHAKRNHISYFEKNFNWTFEELNRGNIDDCIAMNEKWYSLNVEKDREGIED